MHPAFLYLPDGRLSLTELSAARLDGVLVELGDAYVPADLVEGRDLRAASLSALVTTGMAASGPTAAWIHGAGDAAPTRHHARRAATRRIRPPQNPRLVYHDTAASPRDLETIGGIPVTTADCTLFDLVLGLHRDPTLLKWARDLAEVQPTLIESAIDRLEGTHRVPGSRSARSVLERLSLRTK